MANALREAEVPILRAEVGDIAPATSPWPRPRTKTSTKAILGFNVDLLANAETELENADVKLFTDEVIYQPDRRLRNVRRGETARPAGDGAGQGRPAPRGSASSPTTFRQNDPRSSASRSSPARFRTTATSDTSRVTSSSASASSPAFKSRATTSTEARAGERVSIAIDGPTVGRDIEEGDTLWTEIPEKREDPRTGLKRRSRPTSAGARGVLETKRKRDPSGEVNRGLSAYSGEKMPQFVANLSRRGPRAFA